MVVGGILEEKRPEEERSVLRSIAIAAASNPALNAALKACGAWFKLKEACERYHSILHKQKLLRTGSMLGTRHDAFVVDENDNDYLPGCVLKCETCGGQSPTLQAFGGCHGSILLEPRRITGGHGSGTKSSPVRAIPGCLPWPHSCDPIERVCPIEVKSKIHNHVSRGECDGLAPVDTTIDIVEHEEMCDPQARLHRSIRCHGNDFGEGTSTMRSPISLGTSPSGSSDGLIHEHARSILLQGGQLSLDGTAKLTESHSKCETWDPYILQARGGHGLNRLEQTLIIGGDKSGLNRVKARPSGSPEYDGPTMWNVSGKGTSTMLNPGSSGVVIGLAHDLTHTEADIETGVRGGTPSSDRAQGGGTPSADRAQGGQAPELQIDSLSPSSAQENRDNGTGGTRFSDRCPIHGVHEDKWQSNMVDPLVAMII